MSEEPSPSPVKGQGKEVPRLLRQAFDVFARASQQLERSYEELKVRADRLAKELARANEELKHQLDEKERIGNFLNNILESIAVGIIVVSPDGLVALSNHSAERMLGVEDGIAEGRPYTDLFGDSPFGAFLTGCLEAGEPAPRSREVEVTAGEGRRHFALSFAPVLNQAGEQVGSLLVIQDVTRLKQLEEQAVRSERLAAMGEVAAELAHEIRNPLGSIEIFAGLLSRDLEEEASRKLADNIVVGVKSLNAVVSNMLSFTRSVDLRPEKVDINELVRETFAFMERVLVAQGIVLQQDLDDGLGPVEADPELIKQALLNLAQNAVKAMEGGGTLSVSTAGVVRDEGDKAVELRISDTGCGIAPQDLPRIFDPFFSTRRGGTGLGLSVASQIVDKHGGMISAESSPGQGTSMTITLPVKLGSGGHSPSGTK